MTGYRDAPSTFGPVVINAFAKDPPPLRSGKALIDRLTTIVFAVAFAAFAGAKSGGLVSALMGTPRNEPTPTLAWVVGWGIFLLTVVGVLVAQAKAARKLRESQRQEDCTLRSDGLAIILERPGRIERYPMDSARRCLFSEKNGSLAPALELRRDDGYRLHIACTELSTTPWKAGQMIDWNEFDVSKEVFQSLAGFLWPSAQPQHATAPVAEESPRIADVPSRDAATLEGDDESEALPQGRRER